MKAACMNMRIKLKYTITRHPINKQSKQVYT
jgi:hypothetical protein